MSKLVTEQALFKKVLRRKGKCGEDAQMVEYSNDRGKLGNSVASRSKPLDKQKDGEKELCW